MNKFTKDASPQFTPSDKLVTPIPNSAGFVDGEFTQASTFDNNPIIKKKKRGKLILRR